MAVISTLYPTLADIVSRANASGRIDTSVVEMLTETNEMLDDMVFLPANGVTEHVTTVRVGLPSATWRKLNYGVKPSKSKTKKIKDSLGSLEALARVDKALVDLNGNTESFRLSEESAFIEAMTQQMQQAVIYGDSSIDPEKFMGLQARFNDKSAETAANVIDAGGTTARSGKLASMYLVCWGPRTVFGLYPKGSTAGLSMRDLGEEPALDDDGGEYRVLKTHYKWNMGLCVRDWRYIVRIANIDLENLKIKPDPDKEDTDGKVLIDLMTEALEKIPHPTGRMAFYCNKDVRTFLRKQIRYAANVNITMSEVAGKEVVSFDGVPVRRVDALANTEKRYTPPS